MSQTRRTIELLTTILQENGTSPIKAETFRLAKFDHNDAVAPLWRLLFELIYYCEYDKIDDVCVRAYKELSTMELAVYVKREMQYRGFFSKEFALLPNDVSCGSRELLLGLGWLLCKENIISRFINNCTSSLQSEPATKPEESEDVAGQSEESKKLNVYGKIQQLLLLNNKLRLNLRSLHLLQREKSILQNKLHESTYGAQGGSGDRKHLSEMEVHMLRHPQLLKTNLDLLERDNVRLQNLLAWRSHEDHFWKWMGSVLDAKLQGKRSNPGEDPSDTTEHTFTHLRPQHASMTTFNGVGHSLTPMSSLPGSDLGSDLGRDDESQVEGSELDGAYAALNDTHMSLHQAIIKYQSIVEHLERVWQEDASDITDDELDSVLSSISQELAYQRSHILLQNCNEFMTNSMPDLSFSLPNNPSSLSGSQCSEPQLFYQQKPQNPTKYLSPMQRSPASRVPRAHGSESSKTASPLTVEPLSDIIDIEDEIMSLNCLVERLQAEITDKQDALKQELEMLGSKFQSAVCIPPMQD